MKNKVERIMIGHKAIKRIESSVRKKRGLLITITALISMWQVDFIIFHMINGFGHKNWERIFGLSEYTFNDHENHLCAQIPDREAR